MNKTMSKSRIAGGSEYVLFIRSLRPKNRGAQL